MLFAQGASFYKTYELDHSQFQKGFTNDSSTLVVESSSSSTSSEPQKVRVTKPIDWRCPSSTSAYGDKQCLSERTESKGGSYQECGSQYGGYGLSWGFGFTKVNLSTQTWVKVNNHVYLKGNLDRTTSGCNIYDSSRKMIVEKEAYCPSGYDLEGSVCAKYVYQ
jgi:hypothetical protein